MGRKLRGRILVRFGFDLSRSLHYSVPAGSHKHQRRYSSPPLIQRREGWVMGQTRVFGWGSEVRHTLAKNTRSMLIEETRLDWGR